MTSKTSTTAVHPMIAKHNELVALYFSQTGAKRAATGKRINELEVYADIEGIRIASGDDAQAVVDAGEADLVHFEKPRPVVKQSWDKTPDELLALIAGLVRTATNTDRAEVTRATAKRLLERELSNADKRAVTVPDRAAGDAAIM